MSTKRVNLGKETEARERTLWGESVGDRSGRRACGTSMIHLIADEDDLVRASSARNRSVSACRWHVVRLTCSPRRACASCSVPWGCQVLPSGVSPLQAKQSWTASVARAISRHRGEPREEAPTLIAEERESMVRDEAACLAGRIREQGRHGWSGGPQAPSPRSPAS